MDKQKNVFGEPIKECSCAPMTGYFRDGSCNTDSSDLGSHTVCAQLTQNFLEYSAKKGNDLSTPRPEFGFEGVNPGERWCLCAQRWLEAYKDGVAPKVILEATNEKVLDIIPLEYLKQKALDVV
ncbi:MAG: DUF2237 domain-containing protein [Pseudomonadota bacterium]